jgi:hypothetical protein
MLVARAGDFERKNNHLGLVTPGTRHNNNNNHDDESRNQEYAMNSSSLVLVHVLVGVGGLKNLRLEETSMATLRSLVQLAHDTARCLHCHHHDEHLPNIVGTLGTFATCSRQGTTLYAKYSTSIVLEYCTQ